VQGVAVGVGFELHRFHEQGNHIWVAQWVLALAEGFEKFDCIRTRGYFEDVVEDPAPCSPLDIQKK